MCLDRVISEEHTSELQSPVHPYALSLHDALPICCALRVLPAKLRSKVKDWGVGYVNGINSQFQTLSLGESERLSQAHVDCFVPGTTKSAHRTVTKCAWTGLYRKSTRLNSSHPSTPTLFPYTTLFRSVAPCVCCPLNSAPKLRIGVLDMLTASIRSSRLCRSVKANVFPKPMSIVLYPGPRKAPTGQLPNVPGPGYIGRAHV